ncbi:MAG: DUF2064 domain-containing protein [Eggerthellaceae bacterium]|nr:DUF2064 domain-containing protein [Eggerthellaceae bacterium]
MAIDGETESPKNRETKGARGTNGTRRNALLIFSKLPRAGLVKTRLTPLQDGIFTPELAAALYHCMLFDTVEACCGALSDLEGMHEAEGASSASASSPMADAEDESLAGKALETPSDTYDILISTAPVEDVEAMRKLFADSGVWPRELHFIGDTGTSFDEHYNDAFDQAWEQGYDAILSMGADMPVLPKSVVIEGFQALRRIDDRDRLSAQAEGEGEARGGMVLAPDQEMGVSIVGWTRPTNMSHTGVFYNRDGLTVLPAYIEKARERGLPVHYLPAVPDVDTMADLAHNITLMQAIEYCAEFQDLALPWRTIDALRQVGYFEVRVPPNELRDPRAGIDS